MTATFRTREQREKEARKEEKQMKEIIQQIAHLDEIIEQQHTYIRRLENEKTDLKNSLFILRYNRGIRQ
jgi:hypothetical protein